MAFATDPGTQPAIARDGNGAYLETLDICWKSLVHAGRMKTGCGFRLGFFGDGKNALVLMYFAGERWVMYFENAEPRPWRSLHMQAELQVAFGKRQSESTDLFVAWIPFSRSAGDEKNDRTNSQDWKDMA